MYKRDEKKIQDRLKADYDLLVGMGYEVVGVFLHGSQNYGVDYEGSDIDTKAIIVPSLTDLILGKKQVSTTLVLPSNEHIDVKDIRLMMQNIKKQNINYVEILFTKYRYINPKYKELIKPLFDNAEKVARYDQTRTLNAVIGMSLQKLKGLTHPFPSALEKLDKFGYDPKQLHHILRLHEFVIKYLSGLPYSKCISVDSREYMVDVKLGRVYGLDEAKEVASKTCALTSELFTAWKSDINKCIDTEVDSIIESVIVSVLTIRIKEELYV